MRRNKSKKKHERKSLIYNAVVDSRLRWVATKRSQIKETTRKDVLNIAKQVDYVRTSQRTQIKFNINYCEANYHAVYPLSLLYIALITLLVGNK